LRIFQASRRSCTAALYNRHASASCSSKRAACFLVGYKRYLKDFRTYQACRKKSSNYKAYRHQHLSKCSHRPCGAQAGLKQGRVSIRSDAKHAFVGILRRFKGSGELIQNREWMPHMFVCGTTRVSRVPGERKVVHPVGCQEKILVGAGKIPARCSVKNQVAAVCKTLS
jgi:hypothetical protein